mmetsp:Transcript_44666/g.148065  ORF Transcript_44666/g.148065 Transcript_44666/m.148065 type:complete len:526 (-) Transcript_44666:96-1673(-)
MMPAQEGVRRRLPRIAPAVKNAAQRARQVARNVSSGATRLARARQERLATVDLSAAVLLLGCAIVLPLFTFAVAYSISHRIFSSYPEEDRWPKGYFISAALDLQPASNFGAFFLTVALASTVAVAVIRHMIVARRLPAGCEALHRTSLFLSLASALGGNGVAAFPHNSSRAIHNTMAALFFLGNLFHFWIETLLEFREPLGVRAGQSATRFWHTAICALALVFTAVFLGHILGEEMGKLDFGIGKFTAALAEIATVACFLVYIGTYYRSFAATRITFAVEVNTERSDPVWSDPLARQGGWSPLRGSRPPGGWGERGGGGLASPGGVRRSLGTPRCRLLLAARMGTGRSLHRSRCGQGRRAGPRASCSTTLSTRWRRSPPRRSSPPKPSRRCRRCLARPTRCPRCRRCRTPTPPTTPTAALTPRVAVTRAAAPRPRVAATWTVALTPSQSSWLCARRVARPERVVPLHPGHSEPDRRLSAQPVHHQVPVPLEPRMVSIMVSAGPSRPRDPIWSSTRPDSATRSSPG